MKRDDCLRMRSPRCSLFGPLELSRDYAPLRFSGSLGKKINLEGGFIEVKASKSKTASRRLITIQPNLREWLKQCKSRTGAVCPINFYKRANEDRDRAGLADRWPSNGLRHSFASYHLGKFGDAAKLALEMGNSPRMIFKHYRQLVRPTDAVRYWNIRPRKTEPLL